MIAARIDYLYNASTREKLFFKDEDKIIIGRHPSCQFQLKDRNVSSRHCSIKIDGANIFITDLGSTNKTYINGRPLVPKVAVKLSTSDNIRIGAQSFIYNCKNLQDRGTINFSKRHLKLNLNNFAIEPEIKKADKAAANNRENIPPQLEQISSHINLAQYKNLSGQISSSNKLLLIAELQKILMNNIGNEQSLEDSLQEIRDCIKILSGLEQEIEKNIYMGRSGCAHIANTCHQEETGIH